ADDADSRLHIERNTGVLFQDGALFSSLTVGENVQVPIKEHAPDLPDSWRYELALLKVKLAGLPADAIDKLPSQLSGGMRKRAGLARALALDPPLLFLDEPTAGLDPIGASAFDRLILTLRQAPARRAGARAGPGSAAAVPRRAHRRPGPDRRQRLRPPDPHPPAGAGPDRVPHHPRPRHPVRYLRPRGGAGGQEGRRGRAAGGDRAAGPSLDPRVFQRPSRAGGAGSREAGIGGGSLMCGIDPFRPSIVSRHAAPCDPPP